MPTGRCLCGAVQFFIRDHFEYAGYCHCSRCRAATGSAFSAFAATRTGNLQIVTGHESVSLYERNEDNLGKFCRRCGSMLYYIVRNGQYAHVQMGTLLDDPGIQPQFHIFVGSKAPWHDIADSLPQFQKLPPGL